MASSSAAGMRYNKPAPARVRRIRWDGIRSILSLGLLLLSTALASTPPAAWEETLFRAFNQLPSQLEFLLWPLQQAGNALALGVGAALLWFRIRDWRPPVGLLLGGMLFGWAGAKLIKSWVGRGRPTALYDDVQLGFDAPIEGLGFPSGHVVVAVVLAVVLSPYVSLWQRRLLYGLAVATAIDRVFIGAHMPLDAVGGVALGMLVGSLVHLGVGIRRDHATVHLE